MSKFYGSFSDITLTVRDKFTPGSDDERLLESILHRALDVAGFTAFVKRLEKVLKLAASTDFKMDPQVEKEMEKLFHLNSQATFVSVTTASSLKEFELADDPDKEK